MLAYHKLGSMANIKEKKWAWIPKNMGVLVMSNKKENPDRKETPKVGDWINIREGDRGPVHKMIDYQLFENPSEEEALVAFIFSVDGQEEGGIPAGMQFRCDIDETVKMLNDLIVGLENQKYYKSKRDSSKTTRKGKKS